MISLEVVAAFVAAVDTVVVPTGRVQAPDLVVIRSIVLVVDTAVDSVVVVA